MVTNEIFNLGKIGQANISLESVILVSGVMMLAVVVTHPPVGDIKEEKVYKAMFQEWEQLVRFIKEEYCSLREVSVTGCVGVEHI